MAMEEKNQDRLVLNNRSMQGIKHELVKEKKEKSIELTTAAKKTVKRLVSKAEKEMVPTQEEMTGLCAELEREAKFNLVSKDMKII